MSHSQPFCAKSPAPHINTFWANSSFSSTKAMAIEPSKMFTTMPETTSGNPVRLRSPAIEIISAKASSAPAIAANAL
ncbi:Uncharacterised protein [Vibrio cholerae]|uniref:Uncharacterized protein n=1 Tax=Vibrio cholerae TaxID=666 RepID=A0A655YQH7_VIBCL|nr:Uncharacterised protein [Vibrio cholerae]